MVSCVKYEKNLKQNLNIKGLDCNSSKQEVLEKNCN